VDVNPALPADIVNRLMMAKYQLQVARRELAGQSEFGAWQASVTIHDAAETCLVALADYCGLQRASRKNPTWLGDFPKNLEKATGKPFYDVAAIEDVIEVRNPAKHRGRFPGVADVNALVARVALVLETNCQTYLGLSLSNVSLAEMIEDGVIRALAKEAEDRIAASEYPEALFKLKHAWLLLLDLFRERHSTASVARDPFRSWPARSGTSPEVQELRRDLEQWWRGMSTSLELSFFGLDVLRHESFDRIAPIMHLTESGLPMAYRRGEERAVLTLDTMSFALTFVIDAAIRLQEVERIRLPGGFYVIKVKADTEFVSAETEGYLQPAGQVPAGTELSDAQFALGPGQGDSWTWMDADSGKRRLIPFESATVVSYESAAEHYRQMRAARRAWKPGAQRDGDS
jgi:hypothetical protein